MIYITCPGCSTELELDEGFRGGVCRCSVCKTMMTVPDSDDEDGIAERLERPSAPGAPGAPSGAGRPDRPGAPGSGGANRPSASTARPDRPGTPPTTTVADDSDSSEGAEDFKVKIVEKGTSLEEDGQVFYTASGKRVVLSEQDFAKIPSAPKRRMGIRLTIIGIFIVVALCMVAMLGFGFYIILQGPAEEDPDIIVQEVLGKQKNPFTEQSPNVMGWSVDGKGEPILIVVDCSRSLQSVTQYFPRGMDNTVSSLGNAKPQYKVQFAINNYEGVNFFPIFPTNASEINKAELEELMVDLLPTNDLNISTIIQGAVDNDIRTIYYISARNNESDLASAFEPVKDGLKVRNIRFITIWIGKEEEVETPQIFKDWQQQEYQIQPEKLFRMNEGSFGRFEVEAQQVKPQ